MRETDRYNPLESLRTIRLSAQEKERIGHDIRTAIDEATPVVQRVVPWVSRHALLAVLIIFVIGTGSTATLAHWSAPGDFFYPFKLAVNDRAELALTFDEEEKWDVEMAHLERMLNEEDALAEQELAYAEEAVETAAPTETPEESSWTDLDGIDRELRELERQYREDEQEAENELEA